jgi:hypothetical protein
MLALPTQFEIRSGEGSQRDRKLATEIKPNFPLMPGVDSARGGAHIFGTGGYDPLLAPSRVR